LISSLQIRLHLERWLTRLPLGPGNHVLEHEGSGHESRDLP
jgi:hypothetical protein